MERLELDLIEESGGKRRKAEAGREGVEGFEIVK